MEQKTITDELGRKYEALVDGKLQIILGPPEGLVDALKLPEPFATRLHNVLHARGILNYPMASKKSAQLAGALQEALQVDTQLLMQEFHKLYQEASHE